MRRFTKAQRELAKELAEQLWQDWLRIREDAGEFYDAYKELSYQYNSDDTFVNRGSYRVAVVFKTHGFVLKFDFDRTTKGGNAALRRETKLIKSFQRNAILGRHFPATFLVTTSGRVVFQVQEYVPLVGDAPDGDVVERFGNMLGIDDLHYENFGWSSNDPDYGWPVFVDADLTGDWGVVPKEEAEQISITKWPMFRNPQYNLSLSSE